MNITTEVIVTIIATTVVLLLLAVFVIAFVFYFRQKQIQFKADKKNMEVAFEQELLRTQIEVQEQTLQHISQELHDNIGQILSLVKINLNNLDIREEIPAIQKIDTTKTLVSKALSDLRSLSKTLDANYVLRSKLSEALRFELDYIHQACGCETILEVEGEERLLPPQQQVVLFRIAQEVMNNAVKHAIPRTLRIDLAFGPNHFLLRISDDGAGFDYEQIQKEGAYEKGAGLTNMQNRSRMIGAHFDLQSQIGKGTSVTLKI